jgi:large subunit ribosomal protein L10
MSKTIKNMIVAQYRKRFAGVEGALVIELRSVNGLDTTNLRRELRKKQVTLTVVKNTLARKAWEGTPLGALGASLTGPCTIAFSSDASVVDVAREVVAWANKVEQLKLKSAVLDGEVFEGNAGVRRLSKFPTRIEAQARVVTIALTPGGKVVGAAKAPGASILGIVKEIQTRLEKGETIAKAG